jgi:hypothetical protein
MRPDLYLYRIWRKSELTVEPTYFIDYGSAHFYLGRNFRFQAAYVWQCGILDGGYFLFYA